MSASRSWRQNSKWRMSASVTDRREEDFAPVSVPAQASGGWRNTDDTLDTSQQEQRRPPGPPRQEATQASSSQSAGTIAEGRRIYLGNLLYRIKPDDVEEMLAAAGFGDEVESVHISVDAVTGRNPGYCFIDFKTRDGAQTALESLPGTVIQGRPIKIGPCQPKQRKGAGRSGDYTPTFQRWGDWKGSRGSDAPASFPGKGVEQGPYGALDHINAVRKLNAQARVYLGGLGKMINQEENDREVRGYLEGFNVIAISKRITPHPSTREMTGNHHYCFVDFESPDAASEAIRKVDGRVISGGRLKLRIARGLPSSIAD